MTWVSWPCLLPQHGAGPKHSRSDDVSKIFTDACDLLGIEWRQWTRYHVSVANRESVAPLNEHVGPKT